MAISATYKIYDLVKWAKHKFIHYFSLIYFNSFYVSLVKKITFYYAYLTTVSSS